MNSLLVEFLGTFALMITVLFSKGNWIFIGLVLGVAVLLGGKSSGGCYNPAVTLGACMSKNLPFSKFLPYVIVQLLAAALASVVFINMKKK
jgi:aquaporin Z